MLGYRRHLLPLVLAAPLALAQSASQDRITRGKYLVEEVGKCQECHTPRLENGELDKAKWLKGSTLDFQPLKEVARWHSSSPNIAGSGRLFERWGEAALIKYFQTGLGPKGTPADPPMPAYKLTQADAEAVVAYLKSLK